MNNEYDELEIIIEEDLKGCEELGIVHPLYKNCYCEALGIILKNIELMKVDRQKAEEGRKRGNRDAFLFPSEIAGNNYLMHSNIIAFIGKRGSGKTTAVNEFCEVLSNYQHKLNLWNDYLSNKNINRVPYRFYIMPPIDASVLEAKEDLLELIWANMYQVFEAEYRKRMGAGSRDELSKTIMKEFDEVYKNYNNVGHSERREVLGESVLVKLKNVSSSLKTKEAFEKLINDFLELIDKGNMDKESYLVVTVDDLDLNLKKGYEMLEQLHKYLLNWRVIVLIAVDYKQLRSVSERYFEKALIQGKICEDSEAIKEAVKKVKKLNDDYLLKVIPLSNRIYLPGGRIITKQTKVIESKGNKQDVKKFILGKIAEKTLIYYDACGLKKHFCLPNTVRELTSYNHFLNTLFPIQEIEKENCEGEENLIILYDRNHDRFNQDITERMALQLLNDKQMELFKLILERGIERRAEYAVNFIRYWKQSESILKIPDKVDEMDYKYSDLLKEIYDIGRANYNNKVLGHCILASFTSEMVREYFSYCHNIDQTAKERAENRLIKFLGQTFGNQWLGKWIPKVEIKSDIGNSRSYLKFGYMQKVSIENIQIVKVIEGSIKGIENAKKLIVKLNKIIPYLECISLLFSNIKTEQGKTDVLKWKFELKKGSNIYGEGIQVKITTDLGSADFDMFGFIGKEIAVMARKELLDDLCRNIKECITKFAEENSNEMQESDLAVLDHAIQEGRKESIWHEHDERHNNIIYFPFYNLDMSYNIMKRVLRKMKDGGKIEEYEQIGNYFRKAYGYIIEELNKEGEYYEKMKKGGEDKDDEGFAELAKRFISCPFIRYFGFCCETKTEVPNKELDNLLSTVLKSIDTNVGIDSQISPQ